MVVANISMNRVHMGIMTGMADMGITVMIMEGMITAVITLI
jgi:hypothetical protein